VDTENKLHELVQLIVARLTSHPEELKKWKGLIDGNKQYFTKEENEALRIVEREAALGESHKHMMRTILQVDEPKPEPKKTNRFGPAKNFFEGPWGHGQYQAMQAEHVEEQRRKELEYQKHMYEMAKLYGVI
jgi:hypothetical protein